MGADGYKIDLEQLDDAIAKMAAFGTDAAELRGEITRRVDGLHLSWSGVAQAAHQGAHTQLMRAEAQMRENLAELREVGRRAHENYSGAVDLNVKMWP